MSELTVETRDLEQVTLVYPRGFINAHTVRLFEGELRRLVEQRRLRIVLNCADLAYIASAGLGAILGSIEEIREQGGDLRLSELNPTVRGIFEMLGFDQLYRIYASEWEAVSSFAAPEGGAGPA